MPRPDLRPGRLRRRKISSPRRASGGARVDALFEHKHVEGLRLQAAAAAAGAAGAAEEVAALDRRALARHRARR